MARKMKKDSVIESIKETEEPILSLSEEDTDIQNVDIVDIDEDLNDKIDETNGTDEIANINIEEFNFDDMNDNEEKEAEVNITNDINSIFETANNNVLQAKNIYNQNIGMKKELDQKFKELEERQKDFENKKALDYEKIKNYKDEVYAKVTEKKKEIEEKISDFKNVQNKLNLEKERFEEYKKNEIERIKQLKKQQKEEFQKNQNELDQYKSKLEAINEELDNKKRKLELDRIKYDSDKNELANNLLKFNELVSDFTVNIDKFNNKP